MYYTVIDACDYFQQGAALAITVFYPLETVRTRLQGKNQICHVNYYYAMSCFLFMLSIQLR